MLNIIYKKGESKLMKKKKLIISALIIILGTLFTTNKAISPSETPTVSTAPLPCTANVDTNFELNITVADVNELYAWQFNMTFNSTVLGCVSVEEGDFLWQAGSTWWMEPAIDNASGLVLAGDSLFPIPEHGANGTGVLATITFHVKMKGASNLHFTSETALFTWDHVNLVPVPLTFTAKDGFFQYPVGDVNGDGIVSVLDLSAVGEAYGTAPGMTNWNSNCDFNKDDKVDVFDLFDQSKNYGES